MSGVVVGFAGMTHLGVNSAAAAAARGFRVVGYDADAAVSKDLRAGKPPVLEPGLAEALKRHAKRLSYASSLEALSECDLVYLSTDVPTDDSGASDLSARCRPGSRARSACRRSASTTRSRRSSSAAPSSAR
jgi:UDPglucose 6-dehydrogenase